MPLTQFDPPGFLTDLTAAQMKGWSDWVSKQLDEARDSDGRSAGLSNAGPRHQFFNPLRSALSAGAAEQDITWTAFPRLVKISSTSDRQRWQKADESRHAQDEYCEWSVVRDAKTNKITRVDFTSEGPEYWEYMASVDPALVLRLYRELVGPQVQSSDLFPAEGQYDPRNRWNSGTTGGIVHLIQANNTLGAEIELAAAATIIRRRDGRILTSEQELIACSLYGQAQRNSDPTIGAKVNDLARAKADVTLANPVGLCIADLSTAGWKAPDGSDPGGYWKITRGTAEKGLRAVYQVPPEKKFLVGDVTINGDAIEFGAQIADFITIKLTGLATRIGESAVGPVDGCAQPIPPAVRGPALRGAAGARRVTRL